MRKLMLVLVVAAIAGAHQSAAQAPSTGAQPPAAAAGAQPAAPQQKKEIKDPQEYNAYLGAIQQSDENAKAVALEGFLQQYPNSVVKEDALELLMATYQKLNNPQKLIDTATRLLQLDANNLRALALMAYLKRSQAEQGGPTAPQNWADAQQYAQRGLDAVKAATKPEGMSDADFQKFKADTSVLFNGVAGVAALQSKDYKMAQERLQASVTGSPNNLADVYPLALAYLQAPQPDYVQGVWYLARAANLAVQNPAAQQQIIRYARATYVKYHGNDQGWDQVLQAAANPAQPAGFTIQPRPTPAEEAAQLVQDKQVKDMSFDEFQLIFTSGNQAAADKVWNELKDKPIAFAAKVVEATPTKLTLSATADDIQNNVADVALTMVAAIPARLVPKVGSMTQVEGTPVVYTAQPFMITMEKGALLGAQQRPTAAPARKPSARQP
jgi:hypothetical protein